jgi:hypothetical protein
MNTDKNIYPMTLSLNIIYMNNIHNIKLSVNGTELTFIEDVVGRDDGYNKVYYHTYNEKVYILHYNTLNPFYAYIDLYLDENKSFKPHKFDAFINNNKYIRTYNMFVNIDTKIDRRLNINFNCDESHKFHYRFNEEYITRCVYDSESD